MRLLDGVEFLLLIRRQDWPNLRQRAVEHGFHFLVGRPLARLLGYAEAWLDGIPEPTIASFAGTGNPFSVGELQPGERVVDVGSGGGFDSRCCSPLAVWCTTRVSNI